MSLRLLVVMCLVISTTHSLAQTLECVHGTLDNTTNPDVPVCVCGLFFNGTLCETEVDPCTSGGVINRTDPEDPKCDCFPLRHCVTCNKHTTEKCTSPSMLTAIIASVSSVAVFACAWIACWKCCCSRTRNVCCCEHKSYTSNQGSGTATYKYNQGEYNRGYDGDRDKLVPNR